MTRNCIPPLRCGHIGAEFYDEGILNLVQDYDKRSDLARHYVGE